METNTLSKKFTEYEANSLGTNVPCTSTRPTVGQLRRFEVTNLMKASAIVEQQETM